MPTYTVTVLFTVEADNRFDAEDRALELVQASDAEVVNTESAWP